MKDKEMCDEEFNKHFEDETNKQTFQIKMGEPMKLVINYDYYFLMLKKIERLESKLKILENEKEKKETNKIRVIDLLNKKANGEEVPKKIRISHWCYKFEWVEHLSNYYDKDADIDLMSCLSMDNEELNYEVEIIEEDKKIEKSNKILRIDDLKPPYDENLEMIWKNVIIQQNKINEVIDKLKEMENKNE